MRLHIHWPTDDWFIRGAYRYDECRCGARRTTHVATNRIGHPLPGWPELIDKHGQLLRSSGWCVTR